MRMVSLRILDWEVSLIAADHEASEVIKYFFAALIT